MNQNLYMSTLLKAFDILDCFQNDRQELGISDIAAMVDMPVSSVHRIIQSLEFVGMLTQNRENRKYALGSRLLNLSEKCGQYQQFQQIASAMSTSLESSPVRRSTSPPAPATTSHIFITRRATSSCGRTSRSTPLPGLQHQRRPRVPQLHERRLHRVDL